MLGAQGINTKIGFEGNFFGLSCAKLASTGSQGFFNSGKRFSLFNGPIRLAELGVFKMCSANFGIFDFNVCNTDFFVNTGH